MVAAVEPVPAWLQAEFPDRTEPWQSLRSCGLRLRGEAGAGLDMEASNLGYLVDAVEEDPGQEPGGLCSGAVIVEIAGVRLHGLEEDALEEAFGGHFKDGARLLLLDADELRKATSARDRSTVFRVPLGALEKETMEGIATDLTHFRERTNVSGSLEGSQSDLAIVVKGLKDEVDCARAELGHLLEFYELEDAAAFAQRGCGAGDGLVEVEGMLVKSLPARNRRKRKAPERSAAQIDADAEDAAAAKVAKGGLGVIRPIGDVPEGEEFRQFEYLDHTADVILHSWGKSMKVAWEQVVVAFFNHMTDLDKVELVHEVEVEATGHDILDLLFHLLDEFLFVYGSDYIICRRVEITTFDVTGPFRVRARGIGEKFDIQKHNQGTEIKAITMHQMKILTSDTLTSEEGTIQRKESGMQGGKTKDGFPFECYVLVDI